MRKDLGRWFAASLMMLLFLGGTAASRPVVAATTPEWVQLANTGYNVNGLDFDGTRWIAAATNAMLTSTNPAASWAAHPLTVTTGEDAFWAAAANNGARLVAVGSTSKPGVTANGLTAYSDDGGNTWSMTRTGGFDHIFNDIVYAVPGAQGLFVAPDQGTINVQYSTDGPSWNAAPVGFAGLYGIGYGAGQFVAVGQGGRYAVSADGTNWPTADSGTISGSLDLWDVVLGKDANNKNLWVAVGSGGLIFTSQNGKTWSKVATISGTTLYGVDYGAGQFIAVGTGNKVLKSTDGSVWTPMTPPAGLTADWYRVKYAVGRFMAAGSGGAAMWYAADVTPPVTTVAGVPGTATSATVTLTLSASDDVAGVANTYYTVDGGPQTAGTSITVSSEGNHTVQYWSVDKAGNTETVHGATFTIDKTAPTTTVAGVPATLARSDVILTFTASDNLSGVVTHYKLDSGAQQTGTSVTVSTDGVHTVQYWSVDAAGNTETAKSAGFTIDKTAPTTALSTMPVSTSPAVNTDVVVTLTPTDNLSGVATTYYILDGGTQTTGTSVTLSTEGSHTLWYRSVDVAGNVETPKTAAFVIDKTAPTLTGAATTSPNAAGWYNSNVTIHWTGSDALSGINPATQPADSLIATEGDNLSASATIQDQAGNTGSGSVSGIKLDKAAPTLTGAATTSAIYNGWYAGDVTIQWTANDTLSGVDNATLPADSVVTGEGANLTASATVKDLAGNTGSGSVTGIKIDRSAPATAAAGLPGSGYVNTDVTVTLSATDTGSGVAATHYILDGGSQQTGTSVTVTGAGTHTLEYWSTDNVGHEELPHQTATFQIDVTAPTIGHTLSATANGDGWHKAPVTVTFDCLDAQSGLASCTPPQTVSTDGQNQTVTGTATDKAGNTATDSVSLNIDTTKPTLTITPDRAPTAGGWYSADVTLTFTCGDSLSGVATCPGTVTISGEGVHDNDYTATDVAGNSTTVHSTIRIDQTAPTLSGAATAPPNAAGWYNADVTVRWTATDALSGIAAAPPDSTVTGEGTGLSASATVADNAGNTTSQTVGGLKIDRTAPITADNAPTGWSTADVTVQLSAADALSGVAVTHYSLDGGPTQDGSTVTITTDGVHSLQYWSVDQADNAEGYHTVIVMVDKTNPTITHALTPPANAAGWNKADVTVTFTCTDATSGPASCTTPVTVSTETAGTTVSGTATDVAGHSATDSVTVKLDKTVPTISGAVDRAPNGGGWYNADVTVTFTCDDVLSGVAACTSPATLGEGNGQSVTGTVTDAAGNTANTTVSGINIDKTAPALSGAATTPANANGWYKGDVTVHWTYSDALSGIDPASVPTDPVITGEGSALSASASVSDQAGNTTPATVTVKIDRTAPATTDNAPSVWQTANFTVTLAPTDALSGVANTYYTVDGGAQQSGSTVAITTEGPHTISYWSVDLAGNAETAHSVTVRLDKTNPIITHTASPAANGFGWNNSDVTLQFTCADGLSGTATCTADQTVSTEGANQQVTGTATDSAGNSAADTVTVNLDKTAPTISGNPDRAANGFGWYSADVTVTFTCSDALSGVDTCTSPVTLGEGASQVASGTVADKAGNAASTTVNNISVDKTAPTFSGAATTAPNANGWYSGDVTVHWTPGDALSGIDPATVPADSVITGEGSALSAAASVSDKAGNTTPATVSVKIDRTAPVTADDAPSAWQKADVTVHLTTAADLSGVAATHYTVDGGAAQTGTAIVIATEGSHTITYWSVDNADNVEAAHTITVRLDKTLPTISGAADRAPNAGGWYNADVTVTFTCSDALSGVDTCTSPVTLGEGAGQSAAGTVTDAAGNTASTTVSGINIDKTAPALSGAATTSPNADGWYKADVTVHWTYSDTLSGIDPASTPADSVITGEGSPLSAAASVSDRAGNITPATVESIRIDRTAPVTTDDAPAAWQKGDVTVTLTAADALSGVAATYYTVDGGAQQTGTTVAISTEGIHTISYWSEDLAGNAETAHTATVKVDKTLPTIQGATDRAPNAGGWYKADVTVHFTCSDDRSGVAACPADVTVGEGAAQSVTGTVTDNAGNTASATVSGMNVDKTPPALVLLGPADGAATGNARPSLNGTAEPLSSVRVYVDGAAAATLTADVNGAWSYQPSSALADGNHTWKATATDQAGNETTSAERRFAVDTTSPSVTLSSPGDPVRTATPALTGTAEFGSTVRVFVDDALIGTVTSTGTFSVTAPPLKDGQHTARAQAADAVGNTASASVTFTVKTGLPIVSISSPSNGQAVTKTISASGTGTPGATVTVTVGGAVLGTARVSAAGNWSVSGTIAELATGTNKVVASIADETGRSGVPVSVLVRYSPKGTLTGTVVNGLTQQPVAGADVTVTDAAGRQVASVRTDAAGAFKLEGIPAGAFTVTAGTASTRAVVPDGQTVSVTLTISAQVHVAVSASPSSIVGDGKATTTVTAAVTGEDGKPIAGVSVGFTASAGGLSGATAVTGPDGQATVVLTAPALTSTAAQSATVRAAVAGADAATVVTFAPASIAGRVLDSGGQPVSGARVTVSEDFDGDGIVDFEAWMVTGADGRYKLYVPRGNWTYHPKINMPVTMGGHMVMVESTQTSRVGDVDRIGQDFVADRGIAGHLVVAGAPGSDSPAGSLGEGTRVDGAITDANGRTIPLTVDTHGNYAAGGLAPGQYTLAFQVVAPDGQKLAGTTSTVTVGQDGALTIGTPLIDPYGIVTDAVTGNPVAGVKMRLMWADTRLNRAAGRTPDTEVNLPALPGFAPNANADPQMTDGHGAYAWMVFSDADYYLLAEKDGYVVYDSRKEGRNVPALPGEDSYVTAGMIHVGQTIVKYDLQIEPDGIPHLAFVKGYPDGTFQPEQPVTRAEAAAMLARALSGGAVTGTGAFSDVPADHWAAQAIAFVQARGLMVGDPDGRFRPEETITRAELAAVMIRIKGLQPAADSTFADVSGHWAAGVIEAARQAGLVTGFPDGSYHPDEAATRAQFTVVLARTLGRGTHTGAALFSDVPETYWAAGSIEEAAVDHIMKGLSEGAEIW